MIENWSQKSYFKLIMEEESPKKENPGAKWIKRFGFAGFMFFFIKGMLWIVLFIAATYFGCKVFE